MLHHHSDHLVHDSTPSACGQDDFPLEEVIAKSSGGRGHGFDYLYGGGREGRHCGTLKGSSNRGDGCRVYTLWSRPATGNCQFPVYLLSEKLKTEELSVKGGEYRDAVRVEAK